MEAVRYMADVTAGGVTNRGRRRQSTRDVLAGCQGVLGRLGREFGLTALLPDLVPEADWAEECLRRERRATRHRPRHGSAPVGRGAPAGSASSPFWADSHFVNGVTC